MSKNGCATQPIKAYMETIDRIITWCVSSGSGEMSWRCDDGWEISAELAGGHPPAAVRPRVCVVDCPMPVNFLLLTCGCLSGCGDGTSFTQFGPKAPIKIGGVLQLMVRSSAMPARSRVTSLMQVQAPKA